MHVVPFAFYLAGIASADFLKLHFTQVPFHGPSNRQKELGLPVSNDLLHQRYLLDLKIGTPAQHFSIAIDTGSGDLWVPLYNSSGCRPSPCPPGTFVPENSSTLKDTGFDFSPSFGLVPGFQVVGKYYNDTVRVGNAVIPDMTFGVGDAPIGLVENGVFGLVGLGSRNAESLAQNTNRTYPTLYDQLKLHGYTNRRLFSLWLDDQSSSAGTILFGGVDKSKYKGVLKSLPINLSGPDRIFRDWAVNMSSITYLNARSNEHEKFMRDGIVINAILDSGSPNMYLPLDLANSILDKMNATMHGGTPYVSCELRKDHDQFLEFGFGQHPHGPKIKVPYPEIVYPFGYPAVRGNVTAGDGTELCYLGLIGNPGDIVLLGDTFIRSAYLVYDVDNVQVLMAPAARGRDCEEEYVEL